MSNANNINERIDCYINGSVSQEQGLEIAKSIWKTLERFVKVLIISDLQEFEYEYSWNEYVDFANIQLGG